MVERSDGGWTARLTRRRVLALPLVFGMAGCTQLAQDHDPNLQAMKKDPLFLWRPTWITFDNFGEVSGNQPLSTVLSCADCWEGNLYQQRRSRQPLTWP